MHPIQSKRLINAYSRGMADQITILDPDQVTPLPILNELWCPNGAYQVLPAVTYLSHGQASLSHWCNQHGVFSVPTLELSNWLDAITGHDRTPRTLHEVGTGNAILASYRGHGATDARTNTTANQIAMSHGVRSASTPKQFLTRTANQAASAYRPKFILAQWVTPGGLTEFSEIDGRNSYGPNYQEILQHCGSLIFVGNDFTHKKSLGNLLPPPDLELRPDWLLSRSLHPGNFIKLWKGKTFRKEDWEGVY